MRTHVAWIVRGLLTLLAFAVLEARSMAQGNVWVNGVGNGGPLPGQALGGGGVWPSVLPPNPSVFTLNVPALAPGMKLVAVRLNGLTHAWTEDCFFVIQAPTGVARTLFNRPYAGSPFCTFDGDYTIVSHTAAGAPTSGLCTGAQIFRQAYSGSPWSSPWSSGSNGVFNDPLEALPVSAGAWTLRIYDWAGIEEGSLSSFDLCFSLQSTVSYCANAPSPSACFAALSGYGSPSVAASSGFQIQVHSVEPLRNGLIFYGVSGRTAVPFAGTNGLLCVKAPTQRTLVQNSGAGPGNACGGRFDLDWSGFVASHPSPLGAPLNVGQVVNAQAWYRGDPSSNLLHLSNGLEFTLTP